MRISWQPFFRRLASVCVVGTATAWSSALCYAQLASDNASNAPYADGWDGTITDNTTGAVIATGDNGGFGFEPWNFDTDWLFNPDPPDGLQDVDSSSQFNQLGTAWRMSKPDPEQLPRAGRGFAPLQPGQTISVVFDNPTTQQFNKGYFIRFNSRNGVTTGGGNICYAFPPDDPDYSTCCTAADLNGDGFNVPLGADPVPKLQLQQYSYTNPADYGKWGVANNEDDDPQGEFHHIELNDVDTAAEGARLDLKILEDDGYELTIDPIGPGATYTETGTLLSAGMPIDWIEFTFFHTTSDPELDGDFFIRSMGITGPTTVSANFDGDADTDGADFLRWQRGVGKPGAVRGDGDSDGDGDVDQTDLTTWKTQFGPVATAAVPEPATLATMFLAAAGLYGIAPRRRNLTANLPQRQLGARSASKGE